MAKKLSTKENTDIALSKSKSFMGIIKNIFNNKVAPVDEYSEHEELTYGGTYSNVDFDEREMSVAVSRSIAFNSDWIFLHTNLNGAIKWLEDDNWEKQDSGAYVYPIPTDDGMYKHIEVGFDNNNFPILRAALMEKGKSFEDALHPYEQYISIAKRTQDNDFEEKVFQLTKLLEKEAVSREAVLEFILIELDGASQSNDDVIDFINNSGFRQEEYIGAMTNASDEANAIRLALYSALFEIDDVDLELRLAMSVLDNMMKKYSLGKYSEDEEIPF